MFGFNRGREKVEEEQVFSWKYNNENNYEDTLGAEEPIDVFFETCKCPEVLNLITCLINTYNVAPKFYVISNIEMYFDFFIGEGKYRVILQYNPNEKTYSYTVADSYSVYTDSNNAMEIYSMFIYYVDEYTLYCAPQVFSDPAVCKEYFRAKLRRKDKASYYFSHHKFIPAVEELIDCLLTKCTGIGGFEVYNSSDCKIAILDGNNLVFSICYTEDICKFERVLCRDIFIGNEEESEHSEEDFVSMYDTICSHPLFPTVEELADCIIETLQLKRRECSDVQSFTGNESTKLEGQEYEDTLSDEVY